jgi:cation diffusion facilitator family transporter
MTPNDRAALSSAMQITVAVAVLLLFIKTVAYLITGSAAILSDAAESIVHLAAILFAAYSLYCSQRPPDATHPYGFAKISFFSAGFEGALIIVAGIFTIVLALIKWWSGGSVEQIEWGTFLISISAFINAGLGAYLVHFGKSRQSLIVESNGRHILADSYTSVAVVAGLLLYHFTGLRWLDPLCALIVSGYVLLTGAQLVYRSFSGLMDRADPAITRQLTELLSLRCAHYGIHFHKLRHRHMGDRHMVDLHLLFPQHMPVGQAHRIASEIEVTLISSLSNRAHIMTHLEAIEDHDSVHPASEA